MVRPEDEALACETANESTGRVDLAGESPVRVPVERNRKRSCGPRTAVSTEQASSEDQPKGDRERRDRHVRSKAARGAHDPKRALGLPGVVAAARSERSTRNTRGPFSQRTSREATGTGAERESSSCEAEVRGGRSTDEAADDAAEGRPPAPVVRADAGEREGMPARANARILARLGLALPLGQDASRRPATRQGRFRLRGTVRDPSPATEQRPSVSRVRETRTHVSSGGPDVNRRSRPTLE